MKYCIYLDFRNKWRWYLAAEDGKRLATGESYNSKGACAEAIAWTKASGALSVPIEEQE